MEFKSSFTNREQSLKLLKLGVPADSADCTVDEEGHVVTLEGKYSGYVCYCNEIRLDTDLPPVVPHLPCWSIGRLMYIAEYMLGYCIEIDSESDYIEEMIKTLEYVAKLSHQYNFNKLTE